MSDAPNSPLPPPASLEDSPFFKQAEISSPEDVKDPSELSLHLMVKNGAGVVGRLMDSVGKYVHEVVAVLNDCEDDTEAVLAGKCAELGIPFKPIAVTRKTNPELYILDTAKTYTVGKSLSGETFGGPFTEEPILADWASARNIGWRACTKKWRLFLDADDVVVDPHCLPGLLKLLEEQGVEICASPYHYHVDEEGRVLGKSMRERLAVNKPNIRWVNPIHEVLAGSTRICHLQTNLIVEDKRDNKGKAARIPGRNFKIAYYRARTRDWDVSPRALADIAQEVKSMGDVPGMMPFADALLEKYMEDASWPEERGWMLAIVGEMHEQIGEVDKAIANYEESLEIHPGTKTAFRLCRARFAKAVEQKDLVECLDEVCRDNPQPLPDEVHELEMQAAHLRDLWQGVIDAYKLGVGNRAVHQVLDDGPIQEEMEKIHVAGAMLELGDVAGAKKFVDEAVEAFPENSPLKVMQREVDKLVVVKLPVSATYGRFGAKEAPKKE